MASDSCDNPHAAATHEDDASATGAASRSDTTLESAHPSDTVAKPKVRLVVVDDYCTRARRSDCERCQWCCPHGAITLSAVGNAPSVDHALCTGCGICFGVCDAFASTRMTMDDLHARIRRIAASGQRAYITCNENVFPGLQVDANVVVLPCISMLSPEFWTLLLAENIRITIAGDLKYCEDCERGGDMGATLFPAAIEIAEGRTGTQVLFATRIPEKQTLIEKYTDEDDSLGRRAAFTTFAADMGEIASGKRRLRNSAVLQDFVERRERQRAAARLHMADDGLFKNLQPKGRVRTTLFPKQRMVLEAIELMPEAAQRIEVGVSRTDEGLCCTEAACVRTCPTGARSIDESTAKAIVDARLCIGCGICVDACTSGACSVEVADARIYLDDFGA